MKMAFVIYRAEFSIPLGVAYCAAVLNERGFQYQVFEVGTDPDRSIQEIIEYDPDAVGASVYSGSHLILLDFFSRLKEKLDFVGIFGGPHATFFPEIIHSPAVDAVCRGEGELALAEFMEKYRDAGSIPTDVNNFWVKQAGRIIQNPVRPLVSELDTLPIPDRLTFVNKFPVTNVRGIIDFIAHRGCPYYCTFCFNHAFNRIYGLSGKSCYHSRHPDQVCREINLERGRMNLKMVSFVDDCFALDKAWTLDFCEKYRQEVDLPFRINTRVEHLDADRIQALAGANCWLVVLGVEAGNEEYRRRVLKRDMSNRVLVETIKACRAAGIRVVTENIIGLPVETYEQALETLKLNVEASPDYAAATYFTPYPRLELTDFAVEQGAYAGGADEFPTSYMHSSLLTFASAKDKRRIVNLRSFFNLGVHHPYLWPLFQFLIGRPPNSLFRLIGEAADGYYLWKLLPRSTGAKKLPRLIWQYLVSYRKVIQGAAGEPGGPDRGGTGKSE